MQKIFKGDSVTIDNATNLKASPSVMQIAKSFANANFRIVRLTSVGMAYLILTNTPSKNLRVLCSVDDIVESIKNGSMVVSRKLPTLPKPTTKVFKALRFISEQKNGASFSDIQRFICELKGIDFDHRTYEVWSGKTVRTNRGYYSTNIARWKKVYIRKNGSGRYVLRQEYADLMQNVKAINEVNNVVTQKKPEVEALTPVLPVESTISETSEIATEVNSLIASLEKIDSQVAEINAIIASFSKHVGELQGQKTQLKTQLNKVLDHAGIYRFDSSTNCLF